MRFQKNAYQKSPCPQGVKRIRALLIGRVETKKQDAGGLCLKIAVQGQRVHKKKAFIQPAGAAADERAVDQRADNRACADALNPAKEEQGKR